MSAVTGGGVEVGVSAGEVVKPCGEVGAGLGGELDGSFGVGHCIGDKSAVPGDACRN